MEIVKVNQEVAHDIIRKIITIAEDEIPEIEGFYPREVTLNVLINCLATYANNRLTVQGRLLILESLKMNLKL
jgi:hypothetical protein